MKFRKAIIHFGADKTGSTSIQTALDRSREWLLHDGIAAYPPGQWHAQLGSCCCSAPETYIFNTQRGLVERSILQSQDAAYLKEQEKWLSEAPACELLLLSYEGFVDLDEEALGKLRDYCAGHADGVEGILYVRPPIAYAVSAMSQRVKQGLLSWGAGNPPVSPYKTFLEKLIKVFGKSNIHVRVFSQETLVDGDVIRDFLTFLGFPENAIGRTQQGVTRTNESLSRPALVVGEALIEELSRQGRTIVQGDFHTQIGQHLSLIPGERLSLTASQIEELTSAFEPHRHYLESEFAIKFEEAIPSPPFQPSATTVQHEESLLRSFAMILGAVTAPANGRKDFVSPEFLLVSARISGPSTVSRGDSLCFELEFSLINVISELEIGIHIFDEADRQAFGTNTGLLKQPLLDTGSGTYRVSYYLSADFPNGQFTAGFALTERTPNGIRDIAWYNRVLTFSVNTPRLVSGVGYANPAADFAFRKISASPVRLIDYAAGTLTSNAVLGSVAPQEMISLPVTLCNSSEQDWVSTAFNPIFLSYHWIDEAGKIVVFEGHRTPLPNGRLGHGQSQQTNMRIIAPPQPGRYRLLLTPLQELHCWFDKRGFTPGILNIEVRLEHREYYGADVRLSSVVGVREGLAIASTGKEGFLLHGPYSHQSAGKYRLSIAGRNVAAAVEMWADVCSKGGQQVHERLNFDVAEHGTLLAELPFELDEPVNDIEFRLWVSAAASVRVEMLRLNRVRENEAELN